jgi:lipopolysaccharide/colanic/teichoic acid biosynthesis glycosyltransferase
MANGNSTLNKRFFDAIISSLGLLLTSPLLLIVAGLILILNGSPILFRQIRVGRNGRDFVLDKFRTMTSLQKGSEAFFDVGNKNRVTRVGAFLRKTKLDELPQLWNVLKGDMSFVGPRPEVRKWVDVYPKRWAKVLVVRPGITDPASIYYRNEEELLAQADDPEAYYRDEILPHKLNLYEEYVRSRTFWDDILLIFRTILSVLFPCRYSCHQNSTSLDKTVIPSSQKEHWH